MNSKRLSIIILVFASVIFSQISPEDLNYMTENYPPGNFTDSYGILTGASVDLLHALWEEMEVTPQIITVYPWARGYNRILTTDNQVLFTMSRTAQRDTLFKWVGPISSVKQVIIGVSDNNHTNDTIENIEELSMYTVAVIRDDVGEETLRSIGYPEEKMRFVSQFNEAIRLLKSNEVAFVFSSDETFRGIASQDRTPHDFYIAYTINITENYFAFSKNVPDEIIEQYQTALNAISDRHREILDSWKMESLNEVR